MDEQLFQGFFQVLHDVYFGVDQPGTMLPRPFYVGMAWTHTAGFHRLEQQRNRWRPGVVSFRYVMKGALFAHDKHKNFQVAAGEGVLNFWNDPHLDLALADPDQPSLTRSIMLEGDVVCDLARDLLHRYGPHYTIDINHPALQNFSQYLLPAPRFVALSPATASGLSLDFLQMLYDCGESQTSNQHHNPWSPLVERAMSEIDKGVADSEFTVEGLAANLSTSRGHLSRSFKHHLRQSVGDYLRQRRMDRARALLTDTDLAIGAISAAVGYTYEFNFARTFKRLFGRTPTAYRQTMRSDISDTSMPSA